MMILIRICEETTKKEVFVTHDSNKPQVAAQQSDSGKVPMEVVLDLSHFGAT